ncbi:CheR family methyltransferase [Roseomonas sp. BN140053]|uniref:CheR family methyltransferase n=1 Tax=Roseomonas sp. BN140053 TaxID=3391898 RepID=UPI0039E757D7
MIRPPSPRDGEPGCFATLKQLVIERTGHFFYADKDELLGERLRQRMLATGSPSLESYLQRLRDPAAGPAEWGALEAAITIGETFFFRFAEQFAALRDTVLPDLLARNRDTRRLVIWSAGCATGAEPYSLSILLHRLLGEEMPQWRCSILGTDLNAEFLAAAEGAQFGDWALRTLDATERARDFLPAPDGRSWTLRPQYRAGVQFERHNLLDLLDGRPPAGLGRCDLILCRNVLIYFQHDTVVRLVRALGEQLHPEGWMLLGHAETSPAYAPFLRTVALPGTVAFRPRPEAPPPVAAEASAATTWAPLLPSAPAARARGPARRGDAGSAPPGRGTAAFPTPGAAPVTSGAVPVTSGAVPTTAGALPATPAEVEALLQQVRALADAGQLGATRRLCRDGLQTAPAAAALHHYDGLAARGLGLPEEAERAFRRAIYLNKRFVAAHYQLGLLLLDTGRAEAGQRALDNAARLAAPLPDEAVLEETDGMTAATLRRRVARPAGPAGG